MQQGAGRRKGDGGLDNLGQIRYYGQAAAARRSDACPNGHAGVMYSLKVEHSLALSVNRRGVEGFVYQDIDGDGRHEPSLIA